MIEQYDIFGNINKTDEDGNIIRHNDDNSDGVCTCNMCTKDATTNSSTDKGSEYIDRKNIKLNNYGRRN
jgi:hypothetical protein